MNIMKELYKDLYKIETATCKGLITLKECNQAMLDAIEKRHDEFLTSDDPGSMQSWDTMKAYHSMYTRLSRLSK